MKSIYFTLCSNNYIPFALSLGSSLQLNEGNSLFVIGLVDKVNSQLNYSLGRNSLLLPCFDIGCPEFEDMLSIYSIVEFNTAVKPFYFEYLFSKFSDIDYIYYLDPDLYFYGTPKLLDRFSSDFEILLTPNLVHTAMQPTVGEFASLRHGMFNLGFIGLKRGIESFKLIHWWKERLRKYCLIDKCQGIFVDQKWMDLVPLYFEKVLVVKEFGWNMAWWNLSERNLLLNDSGFYVNTVDIPLLFFHFSGYRPVNSNLTERISVLDSTYPHNKALIRLYDDYKNILLSNGYVKFSSVQPGLKFKEKKESKQSKVKRKIKKIIKKFFRNFIV
ncbi:hypothetical protein [Algoriphagus confluentis]|uniref:Glycosyl transferase n=1 Tax=Algoriphagus confluentis TaxID=1697556 RepID=A0ABQ6PNM2_9BACT|nr:hypothetical protein Aconfl_22140 [Algoriphagus confluentis]